MQYTKVQKSEGVAYLTLDRPEKRNALDHAFVHEIKEQFQELSDDTNIRVIIIKANGKAFCAGADLGYIQQLQKNTYQENLEDSNHLMELFQMIYTSSKPVISIVDGAALAGGCGLATVCDFCFATENATFGYTEARIGFVPAIVMVFLLRKLGDAKARELMLSGEIISADKAYKLGMINNIVAVDQIESYVREFALNLVKTTSGASLAIIKEMISDIQTMDLETALNYAAEKNARARDTEDCKKGIAAFLNKEKITWD